MVTAPAPATLDSHALPQAGPGAASNSPKASNSFQSVIEGLPGHGAGSADSQIPQSANSKTRTGKKSPAKGMEDNLAAIAPTTTIDLAPKRPFAQYLAKIDVTSSDHEAARQASPSVLDVSAQAANNLLARAGLSSSLQADFNSPASADAQSMNRRASAQTDGITTQAPSLDPAATAIATDSTNNPARRARGAANEPSASIGVPALPSTVEAIQRNSEESATSSRPARQASTMTSDPKVDPSLFTKGLASTLSPRQDNLAFSLKMAETNATARHAQQATQPTTAEKPGLPAQAKGQERAPAIAVQAATSHATQATANVTGEVAAVASTMNHAWNVAATTSQPEVQSPTQFSEPPQAATLNSVSAMHEAQQILPETPRPAATAAEIMLQLGGKDQAAAIRVTDRAGTVNVSVHAADADLRTSLRSNLGDLASQLSHQGWKTEVVKTGTVLTRGETSQDQQQGGRSPNQQQQSSPQGDRQSQRDRRSNSGQWLAELEKQASGNSGGKN